jgi:hypothetical protein
MKPKPKTALVNVDAAMRRLLAKRHVEAVNSLTSGYMSRLGIVRYLLDLGIAAHNEKTKGKAPGLTPTEWDAEFFASYVRNNHFTRYMNTDEGVVKPERPGGGP